MLTSIWDDVRREFQTGNTVSRLVIVNVAVFLVITLLCILLRITHAWETPQIYSDILHFFMISSSWKHNLTHPWVFFTYMFMHEGFFHILFNMLFLYWLGRIVGDLIGDRHILPLYLLGGLLGGIVYFFSSNLLGYAPAGGHSYMLGASAGVNAIILAAGIIAPNYILRLLIFGDVKLKYIVGILLLVDLIGISGLNNTGGHFAHLGGALMGWFYIYQLRNHADYSVFVHKVLDQITAFFRSAREAMGGKKVKVVHKKKSGGRAPRQRKSPPRSQSQQERIDAILDKIKDTGYDSLTKEEKEFLFNASKND